MQIYRGSAKGGYSFFSSQCLKKCISLLILQEIVLRKQYSNL